MSSGRDGAARSSVVIVGGGFGGLNAARALGRADVSVTLLDRKNHHTFQPLLYQVATAGLNASEIALPIRRVLRKNKNTEVLLAEVESIDVEGRDVHLKGGGTVEYDYLILATGATHSYFGHDEWERFAPGLKTIEDALEIRKRLLFAFEAAEREEDPERQERWLTFVIVGGGPTGVELAGTLAEIAKKTLASDFRRIDPSRAKILLLEGGPNVLAAYVPELREKAKKQLEHLGVEVRTSALVTGIDAGGVWLGEERIVAYTALWAAGVAASPIARSLGVPLDRAGRVIVEPDLSIPGHPEVLVIGDLASVKQADGGLVPGVARAAIDGGKYAAKAIQRMVDGLPREPFHYSNPGSLATIGRNSAVADFGRLKLSGYLAWLAWLFIHILFLIGFRNRFVVLFEWMLSYLTYDRGARLITGKLPDVPIHDVAAPRSTNKPHPAPEARAPGHPPS